MLSFCLSVVWQVVTRNVAGHATIQYVTQFVCLIANLQRVVIPAQRRERSAVEHNPLVRRDAQTINAAANNVLYAKPFVTHLQRFVSTKDAASNVDLRIAAGLAVSQQHAHCLPANSTARHPLARLPFPHQDAD